MRPLRYQQVERRRLTGSRLGWIMMLLGITTCLVSCLALLLGSVSIQLSEVLVPGSLDRTVVLNLRLPRVLLGLIVGGALAGSGVALQSILRNSLADPFVLGVSGGAALGATVAIVFTALFSTSLASAPPLLGATTIDSSNHGLSSFFAAMPVSLMAALGAVGATLLMLSLGRSGGRLDPHSMLLGGVVFNAFAAAVILFLRTLVTPEEAHALLPWLVGSLGYRPWPLVLSAGGIAAIGGGFLVFRSATLNVLSLGEEAASSLGVDVARIRLELILVVSIMVGATVSLVGLIGFVGLVVPHALRIVLGPDHRLLLPASMVAGGAFLVTCDLFARLAFLSVGTEPPVGAVTALVGAPLFLVLMRRRQHGGHS